MTINKILFRTCVATRKLFDVKELIRVVKTPSGNILIEKDKHIPGRGAYISRNIEAINIAKKKKLFNKALRSNVPDEIYDQLLALC